MNEFLSFSAYLIASTLAHGVVLGALVGWNFIQAAPVHLAGGSGGGGGEIFVSVVSEQEPAASVSAVPQDPEPAEVSIPLPAKTAVRKTSPRVVSSSSPLKLVRAAPAADAGSGGGAGGGSGAGTGAGEGSGPGTAAGQGSGPAGEGVVLPAPLRAPHPRYPGAARQSGFEGKVVLAVLVRASGIPEEVELVHGSGRDDCDRAAMETIRNEWFFSPARLNGIPIDWKQRVVVNYKLR